ncbi:TerB family tellurite resistance protein [Azohydromonas aeria]|uniref:TerB family tellurite resistance protein n=1 Tax=Azohydromonas aeria TaxID=2590212 RepID=UPI0012FA3F9E|nr:TerB family tellurite resistance protein [Azohydromonas aeria]
MKPAGINPTGAADERVHAAARIVALALLANGEINEPELDVLRELRVLERLGLTAAQWQDTVEQTRQALQAATPARDGAALDAGTLAQWLEAVDEPSLRQLVLELCAGLVGADGTVGPRESTVLHRVVEQWGLGRDDQG